MLAENEKACPIARAGFVVSGANLKQGFTS